MNTRQRGKEWEQKVCRYLKDKGYFIVDVNFACACGEIDIIAAQRQTLVFIEVKYRRNARYGYALEDAGRTDNSSGRNRRKSAGQRTSILQNTHRIQCLQG